MVNKKSQSLKVFLMDKLPGYNTLVKPLHFSRALLADLKFRFPAKGLTVIAVTGTNGKTTTCFMIWKMLNHAGLKTGLITTVAWGIDHLKPELNHMTTVDSKTLNSRIANIKDQGAKYLVLETTSHALSQFRVFGIPINIAVFTNLTHDHLDYHKTFKNYRKAKLKLFKKAKFSIINADDKSASFFMKAAKTYTTYGIKNGKVRAKNISLTPEGTTYSCGPIDIKTELPGEFNVYNSLAAVAVGQKLGLSNDDISGGIAALESVEGRMTKIKEGQNYTVIVDYAHTPDALEKVFSSIGQVSGRIISVHGGAGRRDESTRAERGKILAKNSDIVIITEDDSRDEDPVSIADQFVSGVTEAGKTLDNDLFVELDRGKAIEKAINLAKKNDVVLLLGKGHEKTILRKDGPVDFEDIKVAKKAILKKIEEKKKQEIEAAKKAAEAKRKAELKRKKADEPYGNITV